MAAPLSFNELASWAGRRKPLGFEPDEASSPVPAVLAPVRPSMGPRLSLGAPSRAVKDPSGAPIGSTNLGVQSQSKRKKSCTQRSPPADGPSPVRRPSPEDIEEGEISFTMQERDHLWEHPFEFSMRMVKLGESLHAKWGAERGCGSHSGLSEERDQLVLDKNRLQEDLHEALESARRAKEAARHYQKDREEAYAERDEYKKRVEELQSELESMKKLKDEAETKVQMVAGKAVDFSYAAYDKAISHVQCLYPQAILESSVLQFDHDVRDERIVRYHSNGVDFDVVAP